MRERPEELGSETEVTGFVAKTVHAYDHRTLALLASTVVYRSGTFVLHDHTAMRWGAAAGLDASDGCLSSADCSHDSGDDRGPQPERRAWEVGQARR